MHVFMIIPVFFLSLTKLNLKPVFQNSKFKITQFNYHFCISKIILIFFYWLNPFTSAPLKSHIIIIKNSISKHKQHPPSPLLPQNQRPLSHALPWRHRPDVRALFTSNPRITSSVTFTSELRESKMLKCWNLNEIPRASMAKKNVSS